jgi:Xaa-Pro aminopeptidase
MVGLYFSQSEYEARWAKVEAEMTRRGYDAAVIWSRSAGTHERCGDVLYLTNWYSCHSGHEPECPLWSARGHAAVIMQAGQKPHLHIDEPAPRLNLLSTDRIDWHMNPVEGVAQELKRRRIKGKVALVGSDFFGAKYMHQLESLTPDIAWVFEDDLVQKPRLIKSARELDAFREAGQTVTLGLNAMIDGLRAGRTEREAASEAAKIVVARGGVPTLIRCSHGVKDEMTNFAREPLTGASADAPKTGDMIRAWLMGPMFEGYWLDPGRTTVRGRPSNSQRDLIEACGGIVEGVMKAIRPGIKAKELARIGDQLNAKAGGDPDQAGEQWPLYGHSVGLFFERPIYGEKTCTDDEVIEANMVCSSEAFLMRKGVGAAGFEQNFIVHEKGIELLTTTPMYFWD